MSRIAEFKALELQLAAQMAELEKLKGNSDLKREIEFEKKLRDLLEKYGFSLRNVIAILDPKASLRSQPAPAKAQRRERKVKRFKNPHTGEVIETKGGNHKVLKEWKAKWPDEVSSWLQN